MRRRNLNMVYKEKLKKVKDTLKRHMGRKYKTDFKERSGLDSRLTYVIRKKQGFFTEGHEERTIATIWKNDFRINVYEKEFEPIAMKIKDDLKKLGLESKVSLYY